MPWRPSTKLSTVDPITWAYNYRRVDQKRLDHRVQPYSLEWLFDSAKAMEPHERGLQLTIMKGRQVGATTAATTFAFWHLDVHGGVALHAVPTQNNAKFFNQAKLWPWLVGTEFQKIKPANKGWNLNIKSFVPKADQGHFGQYVLGHTLGGNMTAEGDVFRGQTAEIAIYDERGQMPDAACAVIKSCLNNCDTPIQWNIGSAGYKGKGLDRFFLAGTRAEWAIKCDHCKKHTVLAPYGSTVDDIESCYGKFGAIYSYRCEHCKRDIDPKNGEWVHNEGDYPSYHLAGMNSSFYDAYKFHQDLISPATTEESLMREIAGLPYGGEGVTIQPQDITVEAPEKDAHNVVMGVDWGGESHYVVIKSNGAKTWVTNIGTVHGRDDQHVQRLYEIAQQFYPAYIGCDFGYAFGRNEKLNDLTGCTWTINTGRSPTPGNVFVQVERDRKTRTFRVVKSWVWERIVEDFRSGKLAVAPGLQPLVEDVLTVHPETAGKGTREWVSYDTTKQHYAACLIYAYAIHLRENSRRKVSVGVGSPV